MAPSNIPLMAIVKEREREREDRQAVMCGADKTDRMDGSIRETKGSDPSYLSRPVSSFNVTLPFLLSRRVSSSLRSGGSIERERKRNVEETRIYY
jgi:hypothetical protein